MPEVSSDATLIIATSWQALTRAETGDEKTMLCNCTVIIVFAAFYIEANLNHFIEKASGMDGLPTPPSEHTGLYKKLAWVYNSFVADEPIVDDEHLKTRLEDEFSGFLAIKDFRNNVSHGIIDRSVATLTCPPKTGPKPMLGLDPTGGRSNGKTEDIFSRTDHREVARGRSVAWAR